MSTLKESDESLGRIVFPLIRKYSKFCARCGGILDLNFKDFHMPFCNKCRDYLVDIEKKTTYEKIARFRL